jgi:haloalkane dehalogenase
MGEDMAVAERPAWVDDELFPFESRFVDIDGHSIHYVDEGSGPTLLFLHGNPTWSFDYSKVIESLRPEFRCIAVDYPGFGLSVAAPGYRYLPNEHAQVIGGFVEALALSGATLVAHDWGGPIGRLLIRQLNLFVNVMIPVGHRLTKPTNEQMTHYQKALDNPARREASAVFPREITASRAFLADIEAGLTEIAALPTLIIWGDSDFAFGNNELRRWQQTLTDHQTVIVKGAGHYVPSDAPEQFAAAIRHWHTPSKS